MKKIIIKILPNLVYFPHYYIYLILLLWRIIFTIYLFFKNIKINEIYKNIFLITTSNKIKNKNILIIHGGGLLVNGNEDLLLANLLLPHLKEYNIISLHYPLKKKYSLI